MDITPKTFPFFLPRILDDLASCSFVSIDFEFSGIACSSNLPNNKTSTLQERYAEIKKSADKYRIVQIGLTICHEDTESGTYILKPFNLYLNPIIDRRLEVGRDMCFQSGAVEFLLENKFCMNSLYSDGVHYLSREEETIAIARAAERYGRTSVRKVIDVKETEHDSLAFLEAVRHLVDDWLALGEAREAYLNIPPPKRYTTSRKPKLMPSILNNFQKRLVHQLIEVEYPSLVTISRPAFIQVIDYDEDREKAIREQRMTRAQERVWTQIGFRWIVEALTGGDLSHLDPFCFGSIMNSSIAVEPQVSLHEFSDNLQQRLKSHRPVLVGHNLFTDVVYLYRCFFGPLPDKLDQFQAIIQEMFPILMDTKYMATHDCGSITPKSSLSEINDKLLHIKTPKIRVHDQHSKYNSKRIDHEAGYDSLLTAQIFIKLSAQLRDGGISKLQEPAELKGQPDTTGSNATTLAVPESLRGITEKESATGKEAFKTSTSTNLGTRFDALDVEEINNQVGSMALKSCKSSSSVDITRKVTNGDLIPRRDAEFWKVYGNKLRPSIADPKVCRSCQETLVRRNYSSAAAQPSFESTSTATTTFPVVKPVYTINAGVALSRPPQITRDLSQFEKAYYFYQKRLNERLALPFTKYFYFKRGTPADEDWKRKIRERQTPARDIGKYNAYSKDAWNDELLVGSVEAEPEHQVEMLVQDAEATVNATSQDTSKKEEIPRPFPRVTEADEKNDQRSLNRALQRTLYLLVQTKDGYWKLPSSPVEQDETLRLAAERTLAQAAGVNMNTWMVGFHPVGHHVYNFRYPRADTANGTEHLGEKTFFMKARIMAGQADLAANTQNLKDFKWLTKEEIAPYVLPQYYSHIKNMLAER
ncbi:ribonuclease H-like domain-containing protein [Aspergillus pseudotamarii]|uniref:Large ribosomal subunit protein mL46 n=1 Tax=Aspergillus pseudotamarii TaxID=132259 RepID=A0A5N6SLZ0_ASPPS|nr:ribonuclease H-like domain-containing protein [Aspergillus pseudotamarii]KAE8134383.1 ribonuclease H-like domain-containing protein [Aspergillus pseudotamarii]